ncbi:uncharacterized protein N7458_010311 [Penicillium daleae]|uniref:Uncharacterized protein n=1 Tax=Penicillium daleae TaxID=63821 RepID=A0AAD6C009_9EURO|nr:uncharacterized protein N7458_010311 [Penicillium daleae]KAJ5439313.1 hypothetical protein N7458_010311 [Penicillium daleae]
MASTGSESDRIDEENDRLITERMIREGESQWSPDQPGPTWLTESKGHRLSATDIEYVEDLPEYPQTSEGGYAYVIPVGERTAEQVHALILTTVQYSYRQVYANKACKNDSFRGTDYTHSRYTCSGAFVCQYSDPIIRSMSHTAVDEGLWSTIQGIRQNMPFIEDDQVRRETYTYFSSTHTLFQRGTSCQAALPSCFPVLTQSADRTPLGGYTYAVTCVNELQLPGYHYRSNTIARDGSIDIKFLGSLLTGEIPSLVESCCAVEGTLKRTPRCGYSHIQGPGQWERLGCKVRFDWLIPQDLQKCPFFVFISTGRHLHPPVPPKRSPSAIVEGLKRLITRINRPDLTTGKFLASPELQRFCEQHQHHTLTELHVSFVNTDRLGAIIRKHRLLSFPQGQSLNGVLFERDRNSEMRDYTREIFNDPEGPMIICLFTGQAHLLTKASSYEVDMSYRRVKDKDIKEVVFASFFPSIGRIRTLCRVFTTQDTRLGYYRLFKRVYTLLERITRVRPPMRIIDGFGLDMVVADMCAKQYFGFADFLHDYDPEHRDGIVLIRQIAIFCHIHFTRGVDDALRRAGGGQPGVRQRMLQLLYAEDREGYNAVIDFLEATEPALTDWAKHKRHEWVMCGLNPACSDTPPPYFEAIRKNTNAVEQTYHKSNVRGRQLTLLAAILSSLKLDRQDIQEYDVRQRWAISSRYADSSREAYLTRHLHTAQQRRVSRNRTQLDNEPLLDRAEEERLQLELQDAALQRIRRQAEEEKLQAELIEAKVRRYKAQKELEELEKETRHPVDI